ncbi:MAG: ABC transporter substrate-binding protein [Myxococcales bacterium]
MKRTTVRRIVSGLVVSMLIGGCEGTPETPKRTIKLGAVIDRSGQNSEPGFVNAVIQAERHANAGLEKAGSDVRFEFVIQDSQSEPSIAVARALEMAHNQNIKGLVADTSLIDVELNKTHYDEDPANDLNVPIICGGCSSNAINNPTSTNADPVTQATQRNEKRWNFKAIMSAKLVAQIVLQQILAAGNKGDVNGDGIVKIGVYDRNEPGVKNTAKDLEDVAKALGVSPLPKFELVLHPRDVDSNSYEWGNDVAKLTDDKTTVTEASTGKVTSETTDGPPDAIVVSTFAQFAASFVKAYKAQNKTIPVWHFQAFRVNSTLDVLGKDAEGEQGVSHVVLDNGASGEVFAADFQASFGSKPVYRNSQYYDAAMALMKAALIASREMAEPEKVTSTQVRDAMTSISAADGQVVRTGADEFARAYQLIKAGTPINYEGASGPMDFDDNQSVKNKLATFKVVGGEFVDVKVFDCISSSSCPAVP